ncbi:hypothetical protein BKA58DRAFT_63889 [Alternaria rosae]|uniref:uncharacterized protein n=1 Tax=Alternaria rosae TaxID=1187941 RepID=UPI001E8D0474|nr:uncharacterized protein BKA58DRAFT_63889 [Alternaria rosae]KAH6852962.1 hypothetical protein BKA58DRAFT_63889 [Alternaria rosae]
MPSIATIKKTTNSRQAPYASRSSFTNFGLKQIRTCALDPHQDSCSICLEPFADTEPATKIIRCGHVFHGLCLKTWLDSSKTPTCPMCRAELFILTPPSRRWRRRFSNIDINNMDHQNHNLQNGSESTNPRRGLYDRRGGVWSIPSLPRERWHPDLELLMMVESAPGARTQVIDNVARWRMSVWEEWREARGRREQNAMGVEEAPLDY